MTLGSFARGALVDIDGGALARMLELDESLFVEHKKGFRDESTHNLARAVAAFANTLGGWILIGVFNGRPSTSGEPWAAGHAPTLVDSLRDRLRDELDPLPAFEARVMQHNGSAVGVVRIYESADTPHVMVSTGSVYVREVAGDSDTSAERKPGAGRRGKRAYQAQQIRSRAQLLELSRRGDLAGRRVNDMLNPSKPLLLIRDRLGLVFDRITEDGWQPRDVGRASIFVRVAPYTVPARFKGWSTSAAAAASVMRGGEELAGIKGLAHGWAIPHPAGVALTISVDAVRGHRTGSQQDLGGTVDLVIDGAGIVGAALHLNPPDGDRRQWVTVTELAEGVIAPVVHAATGMLSDGEFLGRARCQIDLVGVPYVMLLQGQGDKGPSHYVPTGGDLTLSMSSSTENLAQLAANALARSAGLPMWDPPPEPH